MGLIGRQPFGVVYFFLLFFKIFLQKCLFLNKFVLSLIQKLFNT